MTIPIRLALAVLLAFGIIDAVDASCTTSSQSLTFTPGSSYDVSAGRPNSTSTVAGLACSGSLVTLLGSNSAVATVTSLNGFKLKLGSDLIPYQLSADPGGTTIFTSGVGVNYMSTALLSLLGILTSTSFTPSFYAKITGSPNIGYGTYTDTLTVHWVWSVCSGAQVLGACVLGSSSDTGTQDIMVTVTLVVSPDCRISAPNVNFNSAALASQFPTVSQAVLVDCSKGSAYKVSFSSGSSLNARPWRTMSDGNGNTLQYNIYYIDGTTIWDESNPLTTSQNGTGTTTPTQMQAYKAKINPDQTTPPAGSYMDNVNVIITF